MARVEPELRSKSKRSRYVELCVMAFFGICCGAARVNAQVEDYEGIPAHEGHVSWDDGVPRFHQHHFHAEMHNANPAEAQEGHDVAHQLSGNQDYDAYSVWVNEKYMVFDGPNDQERLGRGRGSSAPNSVFGHGFIIPDDKNKPEFKFIGDNRKSFDTGGNEFDPSERVRQAFQRWSSITEDDPHLRLGLGFRELTDNTALSEKTPVTGIP